jgi:hypothetical protein
MLNKSMLNNMPGTSAHCLDQDVLTAAYAAFNARSLDNALAAMHPTVEWPNAIEGATVHGHNGAGWQEWARQTLGIVMPTTKF